MPRFARSVAALVTFAAAWPLVGFAASARHAERVESPSLPALAGGRQDVIVRGVAANVLVFFRPEQDHSLETLKAMAECEREFAGRPVRWLGVVSESWSRDRVEAVVREAGVRMPVVFDEGDRLYAQLGVVLHPTIAIARGDATVVAVEPFRKINYCDIVRAQIRFTLGEIDAAEVARVVSPERAPMPNEIAGATERRNVRMGQMFLKAGNFSKAAETARAVIAKDPAMASAHVLLADALAGQGDCAAAAKEYDAALALEPSNTAAAESKRSCGAGR